jgi:chemotaxis protein methyltransferase CheR
MAMRQTLSADPEGELNEADFRMVADIIHREAGIVVREHKQAMVRGRLARRVRDLGLASIGDYCNRLKGSDLAIELPELLNALTTNHTAFYREEHHFTHLEQVAIPALNKGSERLRVWCAAASSGEEPYTIAATLHACLGEQRKRDCLILATDIDSNVIAAAKEAVYPQSALTRLNDQQRQRLQAAAEGHDQVRINASLRSMLRFRQLNILEDWPFKGPFQIIFCRNMLIYFDQPTKTTVISRMVQMLAPGGFLYLGHSEALPHSVSGLQACGRTTYRRE